MWVNLVPSLVRVAWLKATPIKAYPFEIRCRHLDDHQDIQSFFLFKKSNAYLVHRALGVKKPQGGCGWGVWEKLFFRVSGEELV